MIFIRVKQLLQQVKIRHKKVCHQGLRSVNLRVQIVLVNYKMTSLYKKTKAVVQQFLIKNSLIKHSKPPVVCYDWMVSKNLDNKNVNQEYVCRF